MKGKVVFIPFRTASSSGPYSCIDGELESIENSAIGAPAGTYGLKKAPDAVLPLQSLAKPQVEFSLRMGVVPGWHNHPYNFPTKYVSAKAATAAAWGDSAMKMLADLENDASKANLFIEPFLVMTASRLYDGSHIFPSIPILMIPNSGAPMVAGSRDYSLETMQMSAILIPCSLEWRVTIPQDFADYADIVAALDVFVSSPLPLYNRKGDTKAFNNARSSSFSHSINPEGVACEHPVSEEAAAHAWIPESASDSEFTNALLAAADFHLISSLEPANLKSMTDFAPIPFNSGRLPALGHSEVYHPQYAHLKGMTASHSSKFSGRITYSDLNLTLPAISALAASMPYLEGADSLGANITALEVEAVKNGDAVRAMRCGGPLAEIGEGCFPRFLFYPDPDARKLTVSSVNGTFSVRLLRHPVLHGSYFWCGSLGSISLEEMKVSHSPGVLPEDAMTSEVLGSWKMPCGVWRTEKGNDFLLPDNLLMELDVDRVIAMCRAFRSSGLVATTSPTAYLFTTNGIFLLKEMDDGTLRDAGLISTLVLKDAESYEMDGSVVRFISDDGGQYRIEGTVVREGYDSESTSKSRVNMRVTGDDSGNPVRLITRPIKLGDGEKLKRVLGVAIRGDFNVAECEVELYGSRNLIDWTLLAKSDSAFISGMWGPTMKFVKLKAAIIIPEDSSAEGIVFRYLEAD